MTRFPAQNWRVLGCGRLDMGRLVEGAKDCERARAAVHQDAGGEPPLCAGGRRLPKERPEETVREIHYKAGSRNHLRDTGECIIVLLFGASRFTSVYGARQGGILSLN